MAKGRNVVQVGGETHVIEYSDLPDEAAEMTAAERRV